MGASFSIMLKACSKTIFCFQRGPNGYGYIIKQVKDHKRKYKVRKHRSKKTWANYSPPSRALNPNIPNNANLAYLFSLIQIVMYPSCGK